MDKKQPKQPNLIDFDGSNTELCAAAIAACIEIMRAHHVGTVMARRLFCTALCDDDVAKAINKRCEMELEWANLKKEAEEYGNES